MKMENGELKMSDEKHETIMDIEADLRKRAEALEKALGDQHAYVEFYRGLADRIKAAYGHEVAELRRRAESAELDAALWAGSAKAAEEKLRELRSATLGNAAKLRKALERIMRYNERDDDEFGVMARFLAISRECKTALASPPRNCDRYETEDDAVAAYENGGGDMSDGRALCWWLYYAEGDESARECARIEVTE